MQIKIKETGKIVVLSLLDRKSGQNWIKDLLGNHNADCTYDDDGLCIMDQETYDWWARVVSWLDDADEALDNLLSLDLTNEEREEYMSRIHDVTGGLDLEDQPAAQEEEIDAILAERAAHGDSDELARLRLIRGI